MAVLYGAAQKMSEPDVVEEEERVPPDIAGPAMFQSTELEMPTTV